MLESMEKMLPCGVLMLGDSPTTIYADTEGVLAYDDSNDGGCYMISELIVNNPLGLFGTSNLENSLINEEYGSDVIGIILTSDSKVIALYEDDTADYRSLMDPNKPTSARFEIDRSMDYETED